MNKYTLLIVLSALIVTLSGCSGLPSIPCSQGGMDKARNYATDAAASGAIGELNDRATASSGGWVTTCRYHAEGVSKTIFVKGQKQDPKPSGPPPQQMVMNGPPQGEVRHIIVPQGQGQRGGY